MLKGLLILGGAALILTVVSVAKSNDTRSTYDQSYDLRCEPYGQPYPTTGTFLCTVAPQQNPVQQGANSPWWHKFFVWPEGITALLLALTLGVVTWQSFAIQASVKTARDAIILQHRPKIVVRSLRLVRQESGGFEIRLVLLNDGSTNAHIFETSFQIIWMQTGHTDEVHSEKISAITLAGGKSHNFRFTAPEFYVRFDASRLILECNHEQPQSAFLACSASIKYQDGIGTHRETAVSRLYSFRRQQFVLGDDATETDYSN